MKMKPNKFSEEIINNSIKESGSKLLYTLNLDVAQSSRRQWFEAFAIFFLNWIFFLFFKREEVTIAILDDGILIIILDNGVDEKYSQKILWKDLPKFNFKISEKTYMLSFSKSKGYNFSFKINNNQYKTRFYYLGEKSNKVTINENAYNCIKKNINEDNEKLDNKNVGFILILLGLFIGVNSSFNFQSFKLINLIGLINIIIGVFILLRSHFNFSESRKTKQNKSLTKLSFLEKYHSKTNSFKFLLIVLGVIYITANVTLLCAPIMYDNFQSIIGSFDEENIVESSNYILGLWLRYNFIYVFNFFDFFAVFILIGLIISLVLRRFKISFYSSFGTILLLLSIYNCLAFFVVSDNSQSFNVIEESEKDNDDEKSFPLW